MPPTATPARLGPATMILGWDVGIGPSRSPAHQVLGTDQIAGAATARWRSAPALRQVDINLSFLVHPAPPLSYSYPCYARYARVVARGAQNGGSQARSTAPRQRAAWGTVSREQVVDAAIEAIEELGYEQLTIRSLSGRLGVAPMTLYRHVRNKDDLLDEVTDRLLGQSWRPRVKCDDWTAWIAEAARRLRNLLVTQPAALHVYLRHPVVSPAAILRMEAMLAVLSQAGLDDASALRAYASIHTYTVGFAALEASRGRSDCTDGLNSALERQLTSFTTPQQFAIGLGFLLSGIKEGQELGKA
jgi:AcrR family transcriptional regulator